MRSRIHMKSGTLRAFAAGFAAVAHFWNGASEADAQSLWTNRVPQYESLFIDTSARDVGDLVTIVIRETTDVQNRDQRSMDKSAEASFNLDFSSTGDVGEGVGTLDINKASERTFDGSSQLSVAQELEDRITVQIIDKLPNGNLVLGGRRTRTVAGEVRTLVIKGTAREVDIGPDNSIRSQHVANFHVCYEGDGPQTSFSRQGWAGRFLNKVWPF